MAGNGSGRLRAWARVGLGCVLTATMAAAAGAEEEAATDSAATPALTYSFEATSSGHYVNHAFFGAEGFQPADPAKRNYTWGEGFTRARVDYHDRSGVWGSVGGVLMGTAGPDYLGAKDVGDGRIDQLEIGVSKIGETGLSLVVGRQDLQVGDGFVIGDGFRDTKAALWNIPLNFYDAARADWERGPWHALAFGAHLSHSFESDGIVPKGEMAGGEAGWSASEGRNLAAAYFQSFDRSDLALKVKAGSVRGSVDGGPLTLSGEWVLEHGSAFGALLRGNGGHVRLNYKIPLKHDPYAEVEYFLFTGDDPATPEDEAYFSWNYRWNDWSHYYVADLMGSTLVFNTDARVWMAHFGVTPLAETNVRLLLHRIDLDTGSSYGGLPEGVGRGFADEADLIVDRSFGDHVSAWVMGGWVNPREAAKALVGTARSGQLFVSVTYKFDSAGGDE